MDTIKNYMLSKDWEALKSLIANINGYNGAENLVNVMLTNEISEYRRGEGYVALGVNETPQEIIDLALQKFASTDNKYDHMGWTHSLSHFTGMLWQRGLLDWIAKFNEQAFSNAEKGWGYGDAYGCCDRLVDDLITHGSFDTDPRTLGITHERIDAACERNEYSSRMIDKVKALPFASKLEEDLHDAKWNLADPINRCVTRDQDAQEKLIDVCKIFNDIYLLQKNGVDVDEGFLESDVKPFVISLLEKKKRLCRDAEHEWEKERAKRSIEILTPYLSLLG